jgi:hypothetical protein
MWQTYQAKSQLILFLIESNKFLYIDLNNSDVCITIHVAINITYELEKKSIEARVSLTKLPFQAGTCSTTKTLTKKVLYR